MAIYEKLFNLQKEFKSIKKDDNNPFFKSKYLSLEDILEHFVPLLNKHKIVCLHYSKEDICFTKLIDFEDSSFIESEFKILNSDPQKRGSEITYGRRYNLLQLLNINTTDDDGNIASSDGNTKKFYKKEEPKKWLNYETFKEIVDCGNITEQQISKIIKEDGFTLSNQAKIAVRHYVDTGKIEKNLFFKSK